MAFGRFAFLSTCTPRGVDREIPIHCQMLPNGDRQSVDTDALTQWQIRGEIKPVVTCEVKGFKTFINLVESLSKSPTKRFLQLL